MFWRKSDATVLNDVLAGGDDYGGILVGPRHSQVIRGVCRELLSMGLSPAEVLKLILLIVDLIQKIGPSIKAIVEEIRKRRQDRK